MSSIGKSNIFDASTDELSILRGNNEGYATYASVLDEINNTSVKTVVTSTDSTVTVVNTGTTSAPIYDLSHPVTSAPVDSVNGQTGVVTIDAGDVDGVTAGTNVAAGDVDAAIGAIDSALVALQAETHNGPSSFTFATATGLGSHTDFTGGTTVNFNTVAGETDNAIVNGANGGAYVTANDIVNAIMANSTALQALASALIDSDATNTIRLGPNNLLFENDSV